MSNILVTQEDDGSQWVSLEDYRALQNKFREFLDNVYDIVSVQCNDVGEAHAGLQDEVIAIRKSGLTSRALDAACACGSPAFYTDKVLGVVCCRCQAPRQ